VNKAVGQDRLPGTFFGPSNLVELLRHRARCQPDDIAFTFLEDGETKQVHLTYKELDRQAKAIGAWLQSHGLVGERALLLYPAGLEFIAAFFGCLYAGVIAVPVYPPRRNRSLNRIQTIADDAEAKVALTTEQVYQRVMPIIDQTPHLKQLTWLPTCQVPLDLDKQWIMPDVHGDTLAFLQYTSGSTGTPKGVVLTHANLVHNSALISYSFEHTRSGTGVFWLPSYHDMGLIGGILQPLYVGRPNVLISPMSFLQKPYRWLAAITRFRGTTSGGPNFAYDLCVRKITPEQRKTLDLSSWKVAFNGAEPVRAETIEAFCEAFAPCGFRREAFYPCYGLAEATLIVSGGYVNRPPVIRYFDDTALSQGEVRPTKPHAPGSRALVGCGENLPDQQIVIADPDTQMALPPDRIGEIWVRGPSVAQCYWQKPEATEYTFRARLCNGAERARATAPPEQVGEEPVFLRTGDLGFMLDGELFVTGRLKDLIIIRGVNIYPQDIEHAVQRSHPRLRPDCGAAFTVSGDGREQLIVAQEVERHKQADFRDVFAAIRRALALEFELSPDVILLLKAGSIPKTSSGKIQRHACREGYLAGTLEIVGKWSAAEAPTEAAAPVERRCETAAVLPSPEPVIAAEESSTPSTGESTCIGQVQTPDEAAAAVQERILPPHERVTEIVIEEIRRVARERAAGLTLDTPIVETGMDSLERMEIVVALEERFGGRFPEEILIELETTRDLIAGVEKYLGRPAGAPEAAQAAEIPPSSYQVELFPEYQKLKQNLQLLQSSGLSNPFFMVHDGTIRDRTIIDGRELISFSSYNYLGFSGDPEISAAAKAAIDRYGTSASASRVVAGQKVIHVELERELSGFLGTEDAVVFVGGHATNESVIGHLMGPGDLILHDALAHNSILQGCILSGARRRPFPHNDWQAADELLRRYRHEYRRVLIVIEGIYSMDGDIPELPKFLELKQRHKALLMVDEAHSLGVLGAAGRGIAEHFGLPPADVDIWMGTFSKSLGSCGGYIAGSKALVEYLRYTAPGFVFSAAMPPPAAAAALASLRRLQAEPERVAKLHDNSRLFLKLAQAHRLHTGLCQGTPIVPVILGDSRRAVELSRAMFARGVSVQPIVHPAVEENAARLRFFITAVHQPSQLQYAVEAMVEELAKLSAGK